MNKLVLSFLLAALVLNSVPSATFAQSSDQQSLQQMASLLSSLQSIFNALKAKVQAFKGGSTVQTAQAQTADITTGLVGHWKFDEGSGTTATDSSGNNNTGTLTNNPTWTVGKIGQALDFDGVDDSVSVPSSGSLTIPSDITTSAWIYKSSNSGTDEIVRSGSEHRFKTNGDEVEWTYAGGDDYHITSNINLQTNRWYHVAAVFNNTANTVVIYVDGVSVLTKAETQSATLTGPLYIGKEISAASFFHGGIDDLRLYNRVLSAADIQALYALGSGSTPPPPPADMQAPSVPVGVSTTAVSSSQINLSWTASMDNIGVTGYRVERCQGSSCINFVQISTPSTTSFNDTGLTANTAYRYQVRAVDAAGNVSGYSSIASATTQSGGGGGIPSTLGWYEIPNTKYRPHCPPDAIFNVVGNEDCTAVVNDWTSGVYDTLRNKLYFWGGGHAAYFGNEVYALDMNTLTMSRLYDPSTSPNLQGATGTYLQMNDGRISSRHNYNHNVYIPTLDKVYTFGGSTPVFGSFTNDTWLFDPATLAWSRQTTTGPTPAAAFGMNANWDPNRNLIWIMDDLTLYSYDPATRVYVARVNHGSPSGYRVGFLDTTRKYYWWIQTETGAIFRVSIDPLSTYTKQQITPTGATSILTKNWMGVTYDPVSDKAVMWDTGSTVYTMDLTTFVITANTLGSTPGPNKSGNNGTTGRWRYSPLHGVFVVVNHPDVNAYTFRLSSSGGPAPDTQAPSVPTNLSATAFSSTQINLSWTASMDNMGVMGYRVERCQGASCTNFAQIATPSGTSHSDTGLSANTIYQYQVRAMDAAGNLSSYSSIVSVTTQTSGGTSADADFAARCSAAGVVKCVGFDNVSDFTQAIYPNDGPYAPGGGTLQYLTHDTTNKASGAGSARFEVVSGGGENPSGSWVVGYPPVQAGQTFYVQFRQRFDANMINNRNLFGGGGWKQIIMHSLEAGSCAALEVTMGNGGYYGFPRMYTDCGQGFLDFYSPISNDYVLEWSQPYPPDNPGTPGVDYWCLYNPALQGSITNRCAFYQTNNWITFYYQITVGTWGQPNSTVKAWVGFEGQPLKLVINYNNKVLNKESVAPGFNRLTLTNYDTGRCIVGPCTHPTAYTWYDELIVSTQPIAAPGVTPLLGDLNGDRTVNSFDWNIMAGVWFTNDPVADINKDGIVNTADFYFIYTNWNVTR